MPLKIIEPEKQVHTNSGNFSIRLSMFDEHLHVYITDNNARFRELRNAKTWDKNKWVSNEEQVSDTCFHKSDFVFVLDSGALIKDSVCPPPDPCPPDPCPPDPCHSEPYSNAQGERIDNRPEQSKKHHSWPENPKASIPVKGNFSPEDEDFIVLGVKNIGGVNRSLLHQVTYHIRIPENKFDNDCTLIQLFLKDENDNVALLLSQEIEKADDDGEQVGAAYFESINQKLDGKIDRSEFTEFKKELDDFLEEFRGARKHAREQTEVLQKGTEAKPE